VKVNRLLAGEIACLAFLVAWLIYAASYIVSPHVGFVTVPGVEANALERISKILAWVAAGCVITGILAAAGLRGERLTSELVATAAGLLVVLVLVAVLATSWYVFVLP
jgi:hypothetical protein